MDVATDSLLDGNEVPEARICPGDQNKKGFLKKLKSQARPFLPGERFSGRKGCEQNVKVITILTLLSHHHIDTIIIT